MITACLLAASDRGQPWGGGAVGRGVGGEVIDVEGDEVAGAQRERVAEQDRGAVPPSGQRGREVVHEQADLVGAERSGFAG